MNLRKILAWMLSAAMVIGTLAVPAFAEDKYAGFTDLETAVKNDNVTVEPVAPPEDAGYSVWTPGLATLGNPPLARAKYGELNGEKLFVVWRYANDTKNPYVTAKVKINGVEYKTVIDMTCDGASSGFFTSQNSTKKVKIESGVEIEGRDDFFYPYTGVSTLDIPAEYAKTLNLPNQYWAYYNETSEQYELYSQTATVYSEDRIVLQGANMKPQTLTYYKNANKETATKQICARFAVAVDLNGGTYNGKTGTYPVIDDMNAGKTLYELPEMEGKVFDGWTVINDNNAKTVTLKAKWADAPCVHEFEETTVTPATCTAEGSAVKKCKKCGDVENVVLPKLPHDEQEEIVSEATCTENGQKKFTCVNCNAVRYETINALGHNYVNGECERCHAKKSMEAQIGDTKYDTLKEAIDAANNGDTIVLLEDIERDEAFGIDGKKLTLELNGKTINVKCSGSVISIYDSTVTIKDSVGNGAIIQTKGGYASAVYATTGSTLRLENGKFVSNGQYGAVHTAGSSKCYVSGSVLEGDGGNVAVFEDGSEVQFDNVTLNALFNKTYQMYSDGIWVDASLLTINSGIYNGSITAHGITSQISIKDGLYSQNVKKYVIPGYTVIPEGDMFRVVKATATVIDTAKTPGAEVTLVGLDKHDAVDTMQDYTYKVMVDTAAKEDVDKVNAAISENTSDTCTEKQVFDVSVVKIDNNGVQTDISKTITNQAVTLVLGDTPQPGSVHVYHVNDNGAAEEIKPVKVNGNKVSFTAPSFSTYAVTYNAVEVSEEDITGKVGVVFSPVEKGGNEYYITLKALEDGKKINRLMSADLVFKNSGAGIGYEIEPAANINASPAVIDNDSTEYHFEMNGTAASSVSGAGITIGKVVFSGYGTIDFSIDKAFVSEHAVNIVNTAKVLDNIVDNYNAADDTLVVNTEVEAYPTISEDEKGTITDTLETAKANLTVNIDFPNVVNNNAIVYQDMSVNVKGADFDETYSLGNDAASVVNYADSKYTLTIEDKLQKNTAYTVTVSGAGYRTTRYTVTMTDNKVLNFWNNVKDNAVNVEEGKDTSAKNVTFLAGDIVKDNTINIYDLSAVVSYFGTQTVTSAASDYAKYDLNRDGKIDSKDVAYVLVSWGK